jgi:hypothetical protein
MLHGVLGTFCQSLKTKGKICNITQHENGPRQGRQIEKYFGFQCFTAGWGTWIRTKTNRVRVCCATVTPFPNEALDFAAFFLEVLQTSKTVLQNRPSHAVDIAATGFTV